MISNERIGNILNGDTYGGFVKWDDGTFLKDASTKQIYGLLKNDHSMLTCVAKCWGFDFPLSN